MAPPYEIEATALLAVAVQTCGGDLRVVLARLCACVPPEAIESEIFRAELGRAVARLMERTVAARATSGGAP